MTATLIHKLRDIIMAVILLHNATIAAEQFTQPGSAITDALAENSKSSLEHHSPFSTLNLPEEWGLSALIIKASSSQKSDEISIEQLFLVDKIKALQEHIDSRFQTGLYSLKNNYILSPSYRPLLANELLLSHVVSSDLYQFGRLSTETGYSNTSSLHQQNIKAYIHSAYSVLRKGRFDLSLTASFESSQMPQTTFAAAPALNPLVKSQHNIQATATTLGVIGSFDLSTRWSVISALTVSHLSYDDLDGGFSIINKRNMALIGTTYAF